MKNNSQSGRANLTIVVDLFSISLHIYIYIILIILHIHYNCRGMKLMDQYCVSCLPTGPDISET